MILGELECLLRVSIANEHQIYALIIFRDCILEMFGVSYPIDLIPIPMGDVCVIIGMEWLSSFRVVIDCERQIVVVRTLSREN